MRTTVYSILFALFAVLASTSRIQKHEKLDISTTEKLEEPKETIDTSSDSVMDTSDDEIDSQFSRMYLTEQIEIKPVNVDDWIIEGSNPILTEEQKRNRRIAKQVRLVDSWIVNDFKGEKTENHENYEIWGSFDINYHVPDCEDEEELQDASLYSIDLNDQYINPVDLMT